MIFNQTQKDFKLKYCRICGHTWILIADYELKNTKWWDSNYEYHKLFHTTTKLLLEIREFLGKLKD